MGSSSRRDMNQLAKWVAQQPGWTVDKTRNNHWRFRGPGGVTVMAPSSPSDWRSAANTKADLRRAGLDIPH